MYNAQKLNPVKGDLTEMVIKDFNQLGITLNEADIIAKSKPRHKVMGKRNIKQYVCDKLMKPPERYSKILYNV